MRALSLLLALILLCPFQGVAQTPDADERQQLATDLLEAMGTFRAMEQVFEQMEGMMFDLSTDGLGEPQREHARETMKEIRENFVDLLSGPGGLVEEMVPVFARHFTADEMREAIEFYSTPLGQKLTDMSGDFGREMMEASMTWAQRSMPEMIKSIIDESVEEAY